VKTTENGVSTTCIPINKDYYQRTIVRVHLPHFSLLLGFDMFSVSLTLSTFVTRFVDRRGYDYIYSLSEILWSMYYAPHSIHDLLLTISERDVL